MTYKLIAVDLDDTVLTYDRSINVRSKAAIKEAAKRGVKVVLCTGRTKRGAQVYYDELGLDTLFIASGGAEIFDGAGNAVYTRTLDPSVAKRLLEIAYEENLYANVYIDGNIVFRERNKYTDAYEDRSGYKGIVAPDILEREIHTPKVLFFANEDIMPFIQESVRREFPDLTIARSFSTFLEFSGPGVNKGSALEFAANYYGVGRNDIIAFGDTEIDIPMIKYAGLGVAVANGCSGAREAADIVCASNEQGGVADVIHKYILEA